MENSRYVGQKINLIKVAVTIILMWPFVLNAYNEKTTHPALTDETVDFFNLSYPNSVLSEDEKNLVKVGSTEEDENPRYLMHFYDPVYNRGLIYLGKEWMSSKEWAEDTKAQARWDYLAMGLGATREYFSIETDYTWERAIYDYVWDDKDRGLRALGHILHLIQDASVPDHTRNDPHPPVLDWGSPYEAWTAKFDDKNIDTLSKVKSDKPLVFSDLVSYFNNLAKYSNNNFFSKDTIFFNEYANPTTDYYENKVLSNGLKVEFGYRKLSSDTHKLVRREKNFNWEDVLTQAEFFITDDDDLILTDYWSRLSEQSVLHGAGVIKLFFDEVEKEKQTKYLYYKNRNWFEKAWDWVSGWFGGEEDQVASVYDPEAADEIATLSSVETSDVEERSEETSDVDFTETELTFGDNPAAFAASCATSDESQACATSDEPQPTDGDVLGASTSDDPLPGSVTSDVTTIGPDGRDSFGLYPITILGGGGGGSSGSGGANSSTSEVSASTSEVFPSAPDEETAATTPPAQPDTTPPDLGFSIAECGDSLSQDGCLTNSGTLNFSWSSNAEDLNEYKLACESGGIACANFPMIFASTSTSTIQDFETDNIYRFVLEASDTNGNKAEKSLTVEIFKNTIVINEIAWMGVPAHPEDEYIELYNPTNQTIQFGPEWVLYSATDNSPNITLSGSIPAKGYFLVERKNGGETDELAESPVKDVPADMWVSFSHGLNNSGEHLKLARASSTIDEVERWHAGRSGSDSRTMERFRENLLGDDPDNWASNNLAVMNGHTVDDIEIRGTPKSKNSVSYQITTKAFIDEDFVITKDRGPYIIPDEFFTINEDVNVGIEPGTVIKFSDSDGGRIYIEGVLKAEGTEDELIVFTSIHDDEYGGDVTGNGTTTSAGPGSIRGLQFKPESSGSILDHTIIRYGGRYFHGNPIVAKAILGVEEADVVISNSIFENSYSNGVVFEGTNAIFENNIVRGNADIGMRVEGGAPVLTGNVFESNDTGLWATESPGAKITSNVFRNNSEYAVRSWGEIAEYSGNSGSSNALGGIGISDDFLPAGVTTLKKNEIPYIIDRRVTIEDGEELTFESGVVFKGRASNFPPGILIIENYGRVFYSGATSSEIIFTSIYDDTVGGDSDNSTTTPVAGDWTGIEVASGGELDLSGFTIRYAGGKKISQGDTRAGLRITGGAATITNAVITTNKEFGVRVLDGGSLYIRDSQISNHDEEDPRKGVGLEVNESSAVLESVTFSNNDLDIRAVGAYSITCIGSCNAVTTDPSPL